MTEQTRFALLAATLLLGVAWLTSCALDPAPPPLPSPEPAPEPAQLPAPAPPAESFEEIIVTAQRRAVEAAPGAFEAARGPFHGRPRELAADELWIVAKASEEPSAGQAPSSDPGTGSMMASRQGDDPAASTELVPLPLEHTAVDAAIAGYIGTVQVNQRFANPFDTKIEAVYLFPLPEKAAVSEFLMTIGDRTIRGILREKEEAEAIYRQARAQGYRASLLVQRRPNIFEQKVANIEPGNAIEVDITYFHTLAYQDGWYSFVFPTVVGPRYNPPGHTDPIAALPRGGKTASPEVTGAVEYLAPTERTGHDLGITVRLDAGVEIEELNSTHEIVVDREESGSTTVRLANETTIPNRDFVLDFRVAGETVKSNLLTYRDPETGDGYFTLMVIPPRDAAAIARRPMELVFVIDCSGSMSGRPLEQAREAVATALARLEPEDTFQIIRFSDRASLVWPAAGQSHPAQPGSRTALPGRARQRRRHRDARGNRGGPRFPPEPVALPLRLVHDRRLHRQRDRCPRRGAPAHRRRPHLQLRRWKFRQSLSAGADGEGRARSGSLSRPPRFRGTGDGELLRSRQSPPRSPMSSSTGVG